MEKCKEEGKAITILLDSVTRNEVTGVSYAKFTVQLFTNEETLLKYKESFISVSELLEIINNRKC